jgi:hypothetical protein
MQNKTIKKFKKRTKTHDVYEHSEILSNIKLDYDIDNLICNNLIEEHMMKATGARSYIFTSPGMY